MQPREERPLAISNWSSNIGNRIGNWLRGRIAIQAMEMAISLLALLVCYQVYTLIAETSPEPSASMPMPTPIASEKGAALTPSLPDASPAEHQPPQSLLSGPPLAHSSASAQSSASHSSASGRSSATAHSSASQSSATAHSSARLSAGGRRERQERPQLYEGYFNSKPYSKYYDSYYDRQPDSYYDSYQDRSKENDPAYNADTILIKFSDTKDGDSSARIGFRGLQPQEGGNPEKAKARLRQLQEEGISHFRRQSWRKALALFLKAEELAPQEERNHYLKGRALAKLGHFEEARQALQNCLRLNSSHLYAHFYLGQLYFEAELHHNAISHYRHALGLHPNFAAASLNIAINLDLIAKGEEAASYYKQAIAQKPGWWKPLYYFADFHRRAGAREQAEQLLKRALQLEARQAALYNLQGRIWLDAERPLQAKDAFRRAIALNPRSYYSFYYMAKAAEATGKRQQAIYYLKKAEKLDAGNAKAPYYIAELCQKMGKYNCTKRYLRKALGIAPAHAKAAFLLAELEIKGGQRERGLKIIRGLLPYHSDDHRLLAKAGDFFLRHEEREIAQRLYRQSIRLAPLESYPYFRLAETFQKEEGWRHAELVYEELLHKDPLHAAAHRSLGLLCLQMKKRRKAKRHLTAYLHLQRDAADAANIRQLLNEADEADEAIDNNSIDKEASGEKMDP